MILNYIKTQRLRGHIPYHSKIGKPSKYSLQLSWSTSFSVFLNQKSNDFKSSCLCVKYPQKGWRKVENLELNVNETKNSGPQSTLLDCQLVANHNHMIFQYRWMVQFSTPIFLIQMASCPPVKCKGTIWKSIQLFLFVWAKTIYNNHCDHVCLFKLYDN